MRIRRSASRILGSAYFEPVAPSPEFPSPPPPPPPYLASCSKSLGSHGVDGISSATTASGELCELNRSPWDLPLFDPEVVDDLLDNYCVDLKYKKGWFLSTSMPAMLVKKNKKQDPTVANMDKTQLHIISKKTIVKQETSKKSAKEVKKESMEGESKKKSKSKNEEGKEGAPEDFICKKNDGRGWYCKQRVSYPNTLCDHHFKKKPSNLNPQFAFTTEEEKVVVMALAAPSKPSSSSKTQKKKQANNFNTTEDFYYYAGFGPLHGKRHCRITTHSFAPLAPEQEEVELELPKDASSLEAKIEAGDGTNYGVGAHDDVPSCNDNDDIVGIDEGNNDEYYDHGSSLASTKST